ncbi:MAG: RNA polymerase II holoenzyme cyclin-like subunit [Cirrosporium novae-zelandiae]|nr:MAG: RNA polymerase II holoenzyme cyclin-like subunit [Cirrosporium novae-zelandiae]KAI9735579.1 MAG: RNA polymerase II holoenzyme cyclin-like subunit [Cirrosporium novae-zelandiae]
MAANYWSSTQRRFWLFSKEELQDIREKLENDDKGLVQQYPLPDRRLLSIFFREQLGKLGKRMNIRQQALATAQVYLRRYYTKVEIRRTDPYLVMATCFYLACKMEECPQHIRIVFSEARNLWSDFSAPDASKVGECEFSLISEMNSQLIIHHPYRTLTELSSTFPLSHDETSIAWSIINDSYLTDLPLLYPPHSIAITAIFLAIVSKPNPEGIRGAILTVANIASSLNAGKEPAHSGTASQSVNPPLYQNKLQKLVSWLAESQISIDAVIDCTQDICSLYEIWEQYNDGGRVCKDPIQRMLKCR